MITAELSLYLRVHDTLALAHAAARRAVEDAAYDTEEDYLSENPVEDIGTHIRMLLDPGITPEGLEILDSACEVQED